MNSAPAAKTIGLRDRLYWRRLSYGQPYCCFAADPDATTRQDPHFRSLCGKYRLRSVDHRSCARPLEHRRCPTCNQLEMERRGWTISGPPST